MGFINTSRIVRRMTLAACVVMLSGAITLHAVGSTEPYVKQQTWVSTMLASREALTKSRAGAPVKLPRFGRSDFTLMFWFKTTQMDAPLVTVANPDALQQRGVKGLWMERDAVLFSIDGRDRDWIDARGPFRDDQWHQMVLVASNLVYQMFVDGKLLQGRTMRHEDDPEGSALVIGYRAPGFPRDEDGMIGQIDDLRVYNRRLTDDEINARFAQRSPAQEPGLVACFEFEGNGRDSSGIGNHASVVTNCAFAAGKYGQALTLKGKGGKVIVPIDDAHDFLSAFWTKASNEFTVAKDQREMAWEREDGIWLEPWKPGEYQGLIRQYWLASFRDAAVQNKVGAMLSTLEGPTGLKQARDLYLASRRAKDVASLYVLRNPSAATNVLASMMGDLPDSRAKFEQYAKGYRDLTAMAESWKAADPSGDGDVAGWMKKFDDLSRAALVADPQLGSFDKIIFMRRQRVISSHYYTEYIDGSFIPEGNICVLDLKSGNVTEVVKGLGSGMFGRYDLSFDAKKVVFAWKKERNEGFRIYECGVDGTGLRQLTFPPTNEVEIVRKYQNGYHHGTDDMDPCYLPDGGVCFVSTRCQHGILCDSPDVFTSTVLYRIDGDGSNMVKLTNSSVSEQTPSVAGDGRILYSRWEYVDKGAVSVKCIWSMRPDGTGSAEVYGNDIALPPTMNQPRAIDGSNNKYVILGCPHFSQNSVGTIIRLDMTKNIRTREPMDYMTPDVDVRGEGGYWWESQDLDKQRLFTDAYPLSEKYFLVSQAARGWEGYHSHTLWGLYLLDEHGNIMHLYDEHPKIGCFQPMPLRPRPTPPVLQSTRNDVLAAKNQAVCIVTDVTRGMEGVKPGTVKYLRINEQAPRPWAARRRYDGDLYDQQHAVITKDMHLGLKVQIGIVPVEKDGSAYFIVPADRNIFMQALDANYLEIQRERTYVNYRPGEVRSCVGCHERPNEVPNTAAGSPLALRRAPSVPGPQPGETAGARPLHFPVDVQPVLDKRCVSCHSGATPKGGLNLSGTMTEFFSVSYETLLPERRDGQGRRGPDLVGPTVGENHPKTGNIEYCVPETFGSHASVIVAMLYPALVQLKDPTLDALAKKLSPVHKDVKLTEAERIKLTTWIDSNGQYYGSWWGRRNVKYKDHPNFRPIPTYAQAISTVSPVPEDKQ